MSTSISIKKTFLGLIVLLLLSAASSVSAQIEFKPYGAAHYRLREQINATTNAADENATVGIYSNWFAWRTGVRVKANDELSLQFQIGNDWGYSEQVNWVNNNISSTDQDTAIRAPFQNLYVHVASFKWDPGYLFLEGGVVNVPGGNGPLDLLERSISTNAYNSASWLGWGITNASLIGLRIGAPIIKEGGIKVRAELTQSVVNTRAPANKFGSNALAVESSPLILVNVPIEAGNFKVTPEFVTVINRNYNTATKEGDHEFIGGAGVSYKVSDGVTVTATGAGGSVSNKNSTAGTYGKRYNDTLYARTGSDEYASTGLQFGAGTTIKAGPGNIFVDLKYSSAVNTEDEENTAINYFHALGQYAWKLNPNFSLIPRYRLFYAGYHEDHPSLTSNLNHRFELIFEGSF